MTHMTTICHVRLPKLANNPAKVCRNCMYDTSRLWAAGYKKRPLPQKKSAAKVSVFTVCPGAAGHPW